MGRDDLTGSELLPQQYADNLERRFVGSSAMELARAALLQGGAMVAPGAIEWDCSSDCSNSRTLFAHEVAVDFFTDVKRAAETKRAVRRALVALQRAGIGATEDEIIIRRRPSKSLGIKVTVQVRCRKCEKCLVARRRMWAWRALAECEHSVRTWFGTMTLAPHWHDHFKRVAQRTGDIVLNTFEELSAEDQFLARNKAIGPELTLWLKRVRKESGATFRYLLVCEAHVSGLPHYHCLVHEQDAAIGERVLRGQWRLGHSKFALVSETKQARYVCKYLGKSALARVRASGAYGSAAALAQSEERVSWDWNNIPALGRKDLEGSKVAHPGRSSWPSCAPQGALLGALPAHGVGLECAVASAHSTAASAPAGQELAPSANEWNDEVSG